MVKIRGALTSDTGKEVMQVHWLQHLQLVGTNLVDGHVVEAMHGHIHVLAFIVQKDSIYAVLFGASVW